jgi:ABC-2 type transport system ATP-binding protein/lipopolysaccharide transport system ATP-binding protein
LPDIVEFTGLGDYLDIPVRTYSSGMMTRLTFAVATCFAPEILLMDEWIVAGDASFLTKHSTASKRSWKRRHSRPCVPQLRYLPAVVHKAVWMERGEVKLHGDIESVRDAYTRDQRDL